MNLIAHLVPSCSKISSHLHGPFVTKQLEVHIVISDHCIGFPASQSSATSDVGFPSIRSFRLVKSRRNYSIHPSIHSSISPGSGKIFGCLQAEFFSGFLPTMKQGNFPANSICFKYRNKNILAIFFTLQLIGKS